MPKTSPKPPPAAATAGKAARAASRAAASATRDGSRAGEGGGRRSAVFAPEYRAMLAALRAARHAAGLTLKEVAAALGRQHSFVSKSELGERRLDPIDLWRFAALYGRPITDFLPPAASAPAALSRAEPPPDRA